MDTGSDRSLAEVHFSESPFGPYTYQIPSSLNVPSTGVRVRVPFGRQIRVGFLTGFPTDPPEMELKEIINVIDEFPILLDEMMQLTRWIADYYLCAWGEVIQAALPANLKFRHRMKYRLKDIVAEDLFDAGETQALNPLVNLLKNTTLTMRQIESKLPDGKKLLRKMQARGLIESIEDFPPPAKPKMMTIWKWMASVSYAEAREALPANATKMIAAVEALETRDGMINSNALRKDYPGMTSVMHRLVKREWLSFETVPSDQRSAAEMGMTETMIPRGELTTPQAGVVAAIEVSIEKGESKPFLLHGVTGSGKTLIYLEIAERTLLQDKSVIMLAPEISLTPQLMGRFYSRLGDCVILTHSGMTEAERRNAWLRVRSGETCVVIGPRSAVFAPVAKLGLIIVDEEHEESYKQADPDPRYNGRDVAIYRAKLNNAAVVIGSATPDIISFLNAKTDRYRLLELKERFGPESLPEVKPVGWGEGKDGALFSPVLLDAIRLRLERQEQVILLINRRGFSTWLKCPECGKTADCPNCDITLRYHRTGQKLVCHYCGHTESVYDTCPNCHRQRLRFGGIGSQRIERELELHFPDVKYLRMDLDTTRTRGAHQDILQSFARREADVLLGTKMVAKGHDFPGVTLVGVITADCEWYWPDFRATERAFRLLEQAAGRAGRSSKGEVIIQAWNPGETILKWVREHDYLSMCRSELRSRKPLGYPPYGKLIVVRLRGPLQDEVEAIAKGLVESFIEQISTAAILGPAPPSIERVENAYRRQILLKFPPRLSVKVNADKLTIKALVDQARVKYHSKGLIFDIDVDPLDV